MLPSHVLPLFPGSIEPYLKSSIIGRALAAKKIKISFYDPKKFIHPDRSRGASAQDVRVDRRPYGGGPGMVLRPEPILRAAQKAIGKRKGVEKIFFSTDGAQFDEAMAKKLSKKKNILFIFC